VHYLMNEHADRFADFQARLARAEESRQAFDAAFRGVQDLAGGLRTYLDTGRYASEDPTNVSAAVLHSASPLHRCPSPRACASRGRPR
jgi:hypothetical protein